MEALVPAFVAALLTQIGDRSALLAAILADRYGRPLVVAVMALLAHGAGNAAAALGGMMIAPMLNPDAKALVLALALAFAGVAGLFPPRTPDRLERWRMGSVFTALVGIGIVAAGDSTQFLTLAIAARSPLPWLAAVGATAGAFAVCAAAALLGELSWRGLPLKWVRVASGVVMLLIAAWLAASAFRLI